jgi:D-methionine transport system ATP-binding protein
VSILKIEHLTKEFPGTSGSKTSVLSDINLTIEAGEIFGVVGKSGVGKSTLVRCINRLETPTSGEIYFEDTPMSLLAPKALYKIRQQMGMIFQQFNLLEQRSALKNVCYPMEIAGIERKEASLRAEQLLNLVGMGDKLENYPVQLSGGQRQRVAIARAIAMNPKILLCDEATSALDPETTRGVLELLMDINEKYKITIVVITHEMDVIKYICDRVLILSEEGIVDQGDVTEIFENPKTEVVRKLVYPEEYYERKRRRHS